MNEHMSRFIKANSKYGIILLIVKIHVYTCIVLAVSIEESLKFVRVHFNVVNFFGILHGPTNIINELYETISSKLQLHKPLTN